MATPKTRARTIAVANQKGGVGKTTTVVCVAAAAAQTGLRVLVVDLDPQGDASGWLAASTGGASVADVLTGEASIKTAAVTSCAAGVAVIPAGAALIAAERMLGGRPDAEQALSKALSKAPYDLVLLDCPPALGLLSISAMVAAREVMVPVAMSPLALGGVADLADSVSLVARRINPGLSITAVAPCMTVARQRLTREVLAALVERFGAAVLPGVRASVRVAEAPGAREVLSTYDPDCAVAGDYRALTAALLAQGTR